MIELLSWTISAVVVLVLAGFVLYLFGLHLLPTAERPLTPTYDRFGQLIEMAENPDYRQNPGEDPRDSPDV